MGKLFGTDGVRGIANSELTGELAYKLGQAGAYILTKEKKHRAKIVVGRDTRISGQMLESALVAGICSVGAEAILVDIIPTPAVAHLTRKYKADAGVVISASHNPVEFNGIKFFNDKGLKLRDELELEIEAIILDNSEELPVPTGEDVGTIEAHTTGPDDYIEFAKSTINVTLEGMKIGVDCANGASYYTSVKTLKQLGAEVYPIFNKPNGKNINKDCGSTHVNHLMEYVKENNLDLGIAFDGDADRCLAVDEKGNLIDGDVIMAICGDHMKQNNMLKQDTIVGTVMSNLGLKLMARDKNINIEITQVGDRYVLEHMLDKGYNLGGEQSGHVIFLDYNTTGDGLVTALQLIQVIKEQNKPLSEIAKIMEVLPQVLVNAKVSNENMYKYETDKEIIEEIDKITHKLKDEGRVLIRPSGTEPLVRVMLEGKNQDELNVDATHLAQLIEKSCK